jgi:hypothetical protein
MGPPSLFPSLVCTAIVQSFDLLYEPGHRQLSVTMLRSFFHRRGLNSGRHVSNPYGRLGSIDVLAARPAGPHRLPSKISRGEMRFVDRLQNLNANEPVLALVVRTKRATGDPLDRPAPRLDKSLQRQIAAY